MTLLSEAAKALAKAAQDEFNDRAEGWLDKALDSARALVVAHEDTVRADLALDVFDVLELHKADLADMGRLGVADLLARLGANDDVGAREAFLAIPSSATADVSALMRVADDTARAARKRIVRWSTLSAGLRAAGKEALRIALAFVLAAW